MSLIYTSFECSKFLTCVGHSISILANCRQWQRGEINPSYFSESRGLAGDDDVWAGTVGALCNRREPLIDTHE